MTFMADIIQVLHTIHGSQRWNIMLAIPLYNQQGDLSFGMRTSKEWLLSDGVILGEYLIIHLYMTCLENLGISVQEVIQVVYTTPGLYPGFIELQLNK